MTEEHIVADWVLRAFLRSRTRRSDLGGSLIGPNEVWITPGEAISTARVVCRRCNNEWLSGLDNAAAQALKPLIRGRTDVVLGAEAQSAVSAWIFKCALIFDASQCGESGPLSTLRSGFAQERLAPPGSTICAGPAPQMPFTIDGIPEIAGLTCFGVRPTSGIANVSIKSQRVRRHDDRVATKAGADTRLDGHAGPCERDHQRPARSDRPDSGVEISAHMACVR